MFVDDLADACIFFLNKKTKETLINIGSGNEMKIVDFAKLIIKILKADLRIKFDLNKPDGTPRKIVDIKVAKKYGWKSKVNFEKGLKLTYQNFLESIQLEKKYLIITGGAGFVGSNLISLLLKKTNYEIISLDNYSTGSKKNHIKNKRVKYLKSDTKNISKTLNRYKNKIQSLFHFGEFARIYQSFLRMDECLNSNSI